jgi:hypothetical protein
LATRFGAWHQAPVAASGEHAIWLYICIKGRRKPMGADSFLCLRKRDACAAVYAGERVTTVVQIV